MWTTKLEQDGLRVLERLEEAGHEAYFVGGYVRDRVLGKPVKDIDIATSALPDEVVALFAKTVPTGLQHGTVTVMLEGTPYEVTTFRTESGYADFRRPSEVAFIRELGEDLKRRDFTMNAMAMDRRGTLRDPFGGQDDLARGVLRCVGEPEERFQEDALRMLRCVRFASTYRLEVDAATWRAVLQKRTLLSHVAMERVRVELERMVAGPEPWRGLQLLADSGLLSETKEALHWPFAGWTAAMLPASLQAVERLEEPLLRWALVLVAAGVAAPAVRELLRSLTFSLKDAERIARTVEAAEWAAAQGPSPGRDAEDTQGTLHGLEPEDASLAAQPAYKLADRWKLLALRLGPEALRDGLQVLGALQQADGGPSTAEAGACLMHGETWLQEMPVFGVKQLAVAGQDLIRAFERKPGPWVSAELSRLIALAATGRVPNEKEALLETSRRHLGEEEMTR